MAAYKFIDTVERDYTFEGGNLKAEPGEIYDLETDPADGRWEFVTDAAMGKVADTVTVSVKDVEKDEVSEAPTGDALDSTDKD